MLASSSCGAVDLFILSMFIGVMINVVHLYYLVAAYRTYQHIETEHAHAVSLKIYYQVGNLWNYPHYSMFIDNKFHHFLVYNGYIIIIIL